MSYKRILTIQDISCVGQCSLTVALPILSACGHETAILPSAVLSTHTGGFKNFTVCDLTAEVPKIAAHWKQEGLLFDAIYTGYLGSTEQIDYVADIFKNLLAPGGVIIVDPAMADSGKLYPAFNDEYVAAMRKLCALADIILPNMTEACFLSGIEYKESYTSRDVNEVLNALKKISGADVVFTGIGYEAGETGVLVSCKGKQLHYTHKKHSRSYHGTGDVYSSAFTGALMCGKEMYDAARIAADYTLRCIEETVEDESHWYGVKFEKAIPSLIEALGL